MVDGTDLEAAVRAGVLPGELADRLRNFSAERRGVPAADEERFGLVGGLSDIMTAVGLLLLLGASMMFLSTVPMAATLLLPVTWLLAEHFTRKRRLTLTSFILFGIFAVALAMTCLGIALMMPKPERVLGFDHGLPILPTALPPLQALIIASGTALGCMAWWMRFRLPIAFAAIVMASINIATHIVRMIMPSAPAWAVSIYLLLVGLTIFAIAMRWDMTDIRRETHRADVAFWLHAMAGFQLAGASFRLIFGVMGNPAGWDRLYAFTARPPETDAAMLALLVFLAFCFVALAIDRRSLLMSSLAFVLPATTRLTGLSNMGGLLIAALVLGAMLLALSSFWTSLRIAILARLPITVRAQLPRTTVSTFGPRPVQ